MDKFNPSKLNVIYIPPTTEFRPVDHRKYTYSQSNSSGEMLLYIGYKFDKSGVQNNVRDEVLAEWIPQMGQYVLSGKMHISDGEYDEQHARLRFLIFQREVKNAILAMMIGDRAFFSHYPWLLDSPIYIHFQSDYEEYNKMIYYGTPRQFLNRMSETVGT